MKDENITRRSRNDPGGEPRTDWERIDRMSEEEIEANARSDQDNQAWTDDELANAERIVPGDGKIGIFLKLDTAVVDFFKSQGRGYQARMNVALRRYVREQSQDEPGDRALVALDSVEAAVEELRANVTKALENVDTGKTES